MEIGCNKSHRAIENPHLESDQPLRAKDPNISTKANTRVAASPSYPPSSMPSQSHTSPCDFIEHGPQSDGTNQSHAQFQQFHVHGNFDEVGKNCVLQGQSPSDVPSREAYDLVVPHHIPNTTNYRDHNLALQQQYIQGTHYPSNYSEPPQQRQPDYQQQQWHSHQDQQQYYDGQHPSVYSQQRQDQYRSQDPQDQKQHHDQHFDQRPDPQDQQQYHDQHFDQRPDVYNHQVEPQNQYDQSNAQSARRNLPIDLRGGHHSQRPISHDGYEHTPTPVTPENASNYSSYSSAQASSDIGVDVPSPKPKPKPRMLNPAQQADRKQNTPSPIYVALNPTLVEYPPPNSTQFLVTPNVLQEGIDGEISEAAAAVSHVTMEGERECAPLDPNLICPMCMKQYRIGEIQLYRAHVNKCNGNII